MKPEARLWQAIKNKLALPRDRFDRIENSLGSGYPDVNATIDAEDIWIELKAPAEPKRTITPLMTANGNHPLLESQINWFCRQRQAGGIAFILVRTERHLMLVDGTQHAKVFNDWTLTQMCAAAILTASVPTPRDQWRLLRATLFTASRYHRLDRHKRAQQLLDDMERRKLAGDREPGQRNRIGTRQDTSRRVAGGARSPRRTR